MSRCDRGRRLKNLVAVMLWALAAACLGGCGERSEAPRFKLTDVTGAHFGKESFRLVAQTE